MGFVFVFVFILIFRSKLFEALWKLVMISCESSKRARAEGGMVSVSVEELPDNHFQSFCLDLRCRHPV